MTLAAEPFGDSLPQLRTAVPGPVSRELARRLSLVESRNITSVSPNPPIFWQRARGANVLDRDGNVYIDLTAGFAVAAAGHANARVVRAISDQAGELPHALGDVYPAGAKLELLERLAEVAPGGLAVSILASSGAEAVEAALKTALLRTGRPGIIAFRGSYHGLTYGALAVTARAHFREPFDAQLFQGVRFAPFPYPYRDGDGDRVGASRGRDLVAACLAALERLLLEPEVADPKQPPVGAVVVEPVLGRGGLVVPPTGFLSGLRAFCDRHELVLIFDEVYTGFGRTGRWFACEHEGVVPDILVVGKALTGALPLSAAIGTADVMSAWPPASGEAIHTSTFLGSPIACAAALAQIAEIEERGLVARAAALGARLRQRLEGWAARYDVVGDVRGLGLMQGVELVVDRAGRAPASELAAAVCSRALRRGVLLLAEGDHGHVLSFTPPLVIAEQQLDAALDLVEEELGGAVEES